MMWGELRNARWTSITDGSNCILFTEPFHHLIWIKIWVMMETRWTPVTIQVQT